MTSWLLVAALAASSLLACGARTGDARIGTPRAAREPTCELVVVNETDPATMTRYEPVGFVHLSNAPSGTGPLDPSVRALVRPRACALGGEAISIMASGDQYSRNGLRQTAFGSYTVWAKKAKSAPPQKF